MKRKIVVIGSLWGVFIRKEFKEAPKSVFSLLALMFLLFLAGIGCIIYAGAY